MKQSEHAINLEDTKLSRDHFSEMSCNLVKLEKSWQCVCFADRFTKAKWTNNDNRKELKMKMYEWNEKILIDRLTPSRGLTFVHRGNQMAEYLLSVGEPGSNETPSKFKPLLQIKKSVIDPTRLGVFACRDFLKFDVITFPVLEELTELNGAPDGRDEYLYLRFSFILTQEEVEKNVTMQCLLGMAW